MNIFNYFYYRIYRFYAKHKDDPSYSSKNAMIIFFFNFLFPLIALFSSLFKGYYKAPQIIVAILIYLLIYQIVVRYYKNNGSKIISTYRKYKKYDKYFPYLFVCCIMFLLEVPFLVFGTYFIFKVILPLLDFQLVGCLYEYVDFMKWPF